MNLKEELSQPVTRKDFQRLERTIEELVSKLGKANFEHSNDEGHDYDTSTTKNSIIIDLPVLGDINDTNESADKSKSPLGQLLNHTYPDSVVDLVNKISTNFPKLPFNFSPGSSSTSTKSKPVEIKATVAPPSRELCRQLIEDYFNLFNVYIPILDRRKFIDHWRDKSNKQSQLLVSSVLAVAATRFSDDPSIQKSPSKPGGVFYDAAKSLLDTMYDIPKIETCQALILLANTQNSLERLDTATMYTGMAVQMSNVLRLSQNESTMSPEEDEERRRVFYCIYCVDRWQSFVFGKPYMIDDININIPLPTLPSANQLIRNFFVAFVKLSRILGQIWKFGYSSQPKATHSAWVDHASDQKSTLRQIRGALAKWLQELPEDLQYQYLPSTDQRTIFQLASFTAFAGHINIMFHTCLILLHQPYITRLDNNNTYTKASMNSNFPSFLSAGGKSKNSSILHKGPVKTCLTAAVTITDIAKVTRQLDKHAYRNFHYSIYGIFQSAILELVIMNGSPEYSQNAKKAFNDTVEELRYVGESSGVFLLRDSVKELEGLVQIANGGSSSSGTEFMVPFRLAAQCANSNRDSNQSNNDSSRESTPLTTTPDSSTNTLIDDNDDFPKFEINTVTAAAALANNNPHHQIPHASANTTQTWDQYILTGEDLFFGSSTEEVTSPNELTANISDNVIDINNETIGTGFTGTSMLVDDEILYSSTGGWNHG
ncbi:3460_t:CDS:2 [Ambispora leptoticha]|uniref:3460_t:CDS:1 n=1 Tax=Ambispora leptoticha TaxID=144679 RepID=A0A9N9FQN1_9GLOM|nr:3460_t:CDS:2 [Ambispora leptoticha]